MKNLIGYEWKEASDGNKIEVVNQVNLLIQFQMLQKRTLIKQ